MIADTQGEADVVCSLLRVNGIECGDRPASEMYADRGAAGGAVRGRSSLASSSRRQLHDP